MFTKVLTVLIAGVVIFELIEHFLFPFVWSFIMRTRKSSCGIESMEGKTVQVKDWCDREGRVSFEGELWKAVSSTKLLPGDIAVVQKVEGLVMTVAPVGKQHGRLG